MPNEQKLIDELYANPFSEEFDSEQIVQKLDSSKDENESDLFEVLHICNIHFTELKKRVLAIFDKLNLSLNDLQEFLFLATNKYYLDFSPQIIEQMHKGISLETETVVFSKFTSPNGVETNSQLVIEIGGDILSELLVITQEWKPIKQPSDTITSLDIENAGILFHQLFVCTNIILSLKHVYHILRYEHGTISIRNNNLEIKIESKQKFIKFLKDAGLIRTNNNVQEHFFPSFPFYQKQFANRVGISGYEIQNNTVIPSKGKSDLGKKAHADASVFIFYPHFLEEKLNYFDDLRLIDLLDLLVTIEECVDKLSRDNIENYSERQLTDTPVRFLESTLIDILCEVTGYAKQTVQKFIDSISTDVNSPYFWREPFFKENGFLYFSLAALVAPNHVLYFDKWTALSGYTLSRREQMFTKFVHNDLTTENHKYEFRAVDLNAFNVDAEAFANSILFETASLYILLEVKVFDYPIESNEVANSLDRLGKATISISEKVKQFKSKLNGEKELIQIILTNYNNFSGLTINDVYVADLTLFNNYVFTGAFKRVAVAMSGDKYPISDGYKISYYNNEVEFNSNLKGFFSDPFPVQFIINRLFLKETQITPDFVKPKFFIDTVDHLPEESIMNSRIENLKELLNYEYFGDPESNIQTALHESIVYSLFEIFSQLSFATYESYKSRIELYHSISKAKVLGFVHLATYILKYLEKLNGKIVKKSKRFESIDYDSDEVINLINRYNFTQVVRLSEFSIDESSYTELEEKKIISFCIDYFSGIVHESYNNDILESFVLPLAFLQALSKKYEIEIEFYSACSNVIDALNYIHKYQVARDLCEEILLSAIKKNQHYYGWNVMFKCYTSQKIIFDASIFGCLFLTSISILPEISDFLIVEALYESLKYFRNNGFTEYATFAYKNIQQLDLNEYDKQKIALSYFNTIFQNIDENRPDLLDQVYSYIETKIEEIIRFKKHGILPWLAFFYNLERLQSLKHIKYKGDFAKYIQILENNVDEGSAHAMKTKILGDIATAKVKFISAVQNIFETRSVSDFIYEARHLGIIASNLLQQSILKEDIDGVLLAGLAMNDQSFTFQNVWVQPGSITPFTKPVSEDLVFQLNNYKHYLLSKVQLTEKQLFIWLFEDLGKTYCLMLDSTKEFNLNYLPHWNTARMKSWLEDISKFYFNAKKDADGVTINRFSNPKGEADYNNLIQEEDYRNLLKELSFSNIVLQADVDEIFVCSSINLSAFPHNLIELNNDFLASQKPVCNVISIERFLEHHKRILLNQGYSMSAWIPVDDKQFVIEMGYELLKPILDSNKAAIYTSMYPENRVTTDLNIFLAHGITDSTGFKAVYSNPEEKKAIVYPFEVFGTGKVAILFICNSGSSKEELFANSTVSFSGELLKDGYDAVIAPFWPFDISMSKIWLESFLATFNSKHSINEAVWLANKQLSKYDEESANMFYAPAGCLAMHLYGNPNIYVL